MEPAGPGLRGARHTQNLPSLPSIYAEFRKGTVVSVMGWAGTGFGGTSTQDLTRGLGMGKSCLSIPGPTQVKTPCHQLIQDL